jgi:hypothetical protein
VERFYVCSEWNVKQIIRILKRKLIFSSAVPEESFRPGVLNPRHVSLKGTADMFWGHFCGLFFVLQILCHSLWLQVVTWYQKTQFFNYAFIWLCLSFWEIVQLMKSIKSRTLTCLTDKHFKGCARTGTTKLNLVLKCCASKIYESNNKVMTYFVGENCRVRNIWACLL